MRIGIDIDGVLTNIEQWQLDYASKYYYEKANLAIKNPYGYDTNSIFNVDSKYDEEFWQAFLYDYATKTNPRPFASEVISKLKNTHEIYIITARYSPNDDSLHGSKMHDLVIAWLEKHHIPYDKLIFAPENKVNICQEEKIDIMIDDSVTNVTNISKVMPVICFNALYNQHLNGTNIIRAYSWYDILRIIENIKK